MKCDVSPTTVYPMGSSDLGALSSQGFWPVSRVLMGVLFINAAQAKMTNQQDGN
jgi:hypothetical protein